MVTKINRNVKDTTVKVEKYAKEVDGKMTLLLESKENESIAKQDLAMKTGEEKGAKDNQALTDAKPQGSK